MIFWIIQSIFIHKYFFKKVVYYILNTMNKKSPFHLQMLRKSPGMTNPRHPWHPQGQFLTITVSPVHNISGDFLSTCKHNIYYFCLIISHFSFFFFKSRNEALQLKPNSANEESRCLNSSNPLKRKKQLIQKKTFLIS